MTITIPDDVARTAGLDEQEALKELAFTLYAGGRLSGSKLRSLCGIGFFEFERLATERGLPVMEYTDEAFEQDMQTLRALKEL